MKKTADISHTSEEYQTAFKDGARAALDWLDEFSKIWPAVSGPQAMAVRIINRELRARIKSAGWPGSEATDSRDPQRWGYREHRKGVGE